jgi:hypothetical protein
VNEVRNRDLAFIDYCYAHNQTVYLDSDAFMDDVSSKAVPFAIFRPTYYLPE